MYKSTLQKFIDVGISYENRITGSANLKISTFNNIGLIAQNLI
jgi:hypothetical protein